MNIVLSKKVYLSFFCGLLLQASPLYALEKMSFQTHKPVHPNRAAPLKSKSGRQGVGEEGQKSGTQNPTAQEAMSKVKSFCEETIRVLKNSRSPQEFQHFFEKYWNIKFLARSLNPFMFKGRGDAVDQKFLSQFQALILQDIASDYFLKMKESYQDDQISEITPRVKGRSTRVSVTISSKSGHRVIKALFCYREGIGLCDILYNENLSLLDEKKRQYRELLRSSAVNGTQGNKQERYDAFLNKMKEHAGRN